MTCPQFQKLRISGMFLFMFISNFLKSDCPNSWHLKKKRVNTLKNLPRTVYNWNKTETLHNNFEIIKKNRGFFIYLLLNFNFWLFFIKILKSRKKITNRITSRKINSKVLWIEWFLNKRANNCFYVKRHCVNF